MLACDLVYYWSCGPCTSASHTFCRANHHVLWVLLSNTNNPSAVVLSLSLLSRPHGLFCHPPTCPTYSTVCSTSRTLAQDCTLSGCQSLAVPCCHWWLHLMLCCSLTMWRCTWWHQMRGLSTCTGKDRACACRPTYSKLSTACALTLQTCRALVKEWKPAMVFSAHQWRSVAL